MAIAKKVLISYIVGGVGIAGGVGGLVYGLTKKPQQIVTTGHTLHVKYLNSPSAKDDIATYEHMLTIPESTVKTIASLPFDDPKDQDHHTKALDKIYSDLDKKHVVYDGTTYHKVTLTEDATWYVDLKPSHYHIYLHYWNDETGDTVYNPSDWYPTKAYDATTLGFTQRGAPTEVKNYEFLGWQLSLNNKPTATTREECLYGVGETPRPDNYGNEWPVIPDRMIDPSGKIEPHTWHLHPIYKLQSTTFTFYNQKDPSGSKTIRDDITVPAVVNEPREEFAPPAAEDIAHFNFNGWKYRNDTTIKINGVETPRAADAEFKEEDYSAEFLEPNISLYADLKQYQHKATFYMNDDQENPETQEVWVNMDESGKAKITTSDLPNKEPTTAETGKKFLKWQHASGGDVDWTNEILENDYKEYKPYFDTAAAVLTIDFNGANWVKGESKIPAQLSNPVYLFANKRYTSAELTKAIREAQGIDEGYELVGNDSTPNFYGWLINNQIKDSYEFAEGATSVTASFTDADHINITFISNGGYFTYTDNSLGQTVSVTAISYPLSISEWETAHEGQVKLGDVYAEVLKENTEHTAITLTRDGFKHDNDSYYSGWAFGGNNMPNEYNLDRSMPLTAIWQEKPASNDWWSDDWYTIAKLADTADSNATITGTKLETQYATAFAGKDADGDNVDDEGKLANSFVGLEKEISLPQLGTDKFTVRVIGQGEDTTTDNKTTLLTIDFVDCPAVGPLGVTNDYVDDFASFNNSSTKASIISALPEGLRSSLRTVVKPIIDVNVTYDEEGKPVSADRSLKTFNSNMFLLSTYEVNGQTNISANIENTTNTPFKRYSYYGQFTANDQGTSSTSNFYRCKKYNGELISWWTRTPAIQGLYGWRDTGASGFTTTSWYVSENEHSGTSTKPYEGGMWMYSCREARGLAPAFCIGTLLK